MKICTPCCLCQKVLKRSLQLSEIPLAKIVLQAILRMISQNIGEMLYELLKRIMKNVKIVHSLVAFFKSLGLRHHHSYVAWSSPICTLNGNRKCHFWCQKRATFIRRLYENSIYKRWFVKQLMQIVKLTFILYCMYIDVDKDNGIWWNCKFLTFQYPFLLTKAINRWNLKTRWRLSCAGS